MGAFQRAVGEIAQTLGLRQPQVTKHLQTLQRAGLVTMHPLGQRRIYALRRAPLRDLRGWLEGFEAEHPSESVLEQYRAAIAAERKGAGRRSFEFERLLPASPAKVWRAWTDAGWVARWWAPQHFRVAECVVEPVPGGVFRVVMEEGDGTRHVGAGQFRSLDRPRALTFEFAPLDPAGKPLFTAVHDVRLARRGSGTLLRQEIRVTRVRPEAAPAVAGIQLGWEQLLDKLAGELGSSR